MFRLLTPVMPALLAWACRSVLLNFSQSILSLPDGSAAAGFGSAFASCRANERARPGDASVEFLDGVGVSRGQKVVLELVAIDAGSESC